MNANKKPEEEQYRTEAPEAASKPTLYKFYVRKYDLIIEAETAKEAVKLAKKLSKKEEK